MTILLLITLFAATRPAPAAVPLSAAPAFSETVAPGAPADSFPTLGLGSLSGFT